MELVRKRGLSRLMALMAVLLTAGLLVSACGSDDDSDSSGGSSSSADSAAVQEARDWLKPRQDPETLPYKIPESSPPIAGDKSILVVLAGAGSPGGKMAADALTEAGKKLGWKTRTVDGQFNPKVWNEAIGSATSSNVDAIVLDALPPEAVAASVERAADEGIKVVSQFNPVPQSELLPGVLGDVSAGGFEGGMAQAAWVAADSEGDAKILFYEDEAIALTRTRIDGFEAGLKKFCPGCEILHRFGIDQATMAEALPGQMAGDLRRFGTKFTADDPGYIVAPHDPAGLSMMQGIDDAQFADKVKMTSIDAFPAMLDILRQGGPLKSDWAQALSWVGWSSADQLNRIFNDEPPASYQGDKYQVQSILLEQDTAPPGDVWEPTFDYVAAFEKLWGVE